jgi:hypothetical protein
MEHKRELKQREKRKKKILRVRRLSVCDRKHKKILRRPSEY